MTIRYTIRARFDGEPVTVTLRPEHWLPWLLRTDGTAIGTTVYLRKPMTETSDILLGHELVHVLDFVRCRRRVWRQSYGLAVVVDLAAYLWSWVASGFDYYGMPEEIKAYGEQALVAHATHPDIQWGWQ